MTAPKSNSSTTEIDATPSERPSSVLERLLLDVEAPDDILIDVSRRSTTTGRVRKLTTVGTPPPELTLDEFILGLFGGGRFALRFRIRGQRGQRAVETAELDLRGYEEKPDPPQGWAAHFSAMERGQLPQQDEDDELGADVAELRGADPLLAQLIFDARSERRIAQERYETERRTAEEYRRAQDQRTHEILLALIQRPQPAASIAAPVTSPYASKIEKVLMDRALESVLGGGGSGGGATAPSGGDDDELDDIFAGGGGLGKLLRPALEGFGARFADMMGSDDDDQDDDDDDQEEGQTEQADLQTEAELARQRRAARARARMIQQEKARRAQQRSAGAGSDPTPGGRKDHSNGSPETSIPPISVPSSPEPER